MIYTEDILFLHYPKTAGMLLSAELIKKLKGRINYTLPLEDVSPKEKLRWFFGGVRIHDGLRHESLISAEEHLLKKGRTLDSFKKILTIVRNPYDHAVSRYHYLKQVRHDNKGLVAQAARNGDFRYYLKTAPQYYDPILFMYKKDGAKPSNLELIKYEELSTINKLLSNFIKSPIDFSQRINTSNRDDFTQYVNNAEIETLVYNRYKILFDENFYSRLSF